MAEPNPKVAKSRPGVPAGNDSSGQMLNFSSLQGKNTPAPASTNVPDDHLPVTSLAKNAPVPSGGDENHDVNPAVQAPRVPVDSYASKPGKGLPVPLS